MPHGGDAPFSTPTGATRKAWWTRLSSGHTFADWRVVRWSRVDRHSRCSQSVGSGGRCATRSETLRDPAAILLLHLGRAGSAHQCHADKSRGVLVLRFDRAIRQTRQQCSRASGAERSGRRARAARKWKRLNCGWVWRIILSARRTIRGSFRQRRFITRSCPGGLSGQRCGAVRQRSAAEPW